MVPETASLEATVDVGTSTPYAEVRETHSAVVFLVGDRAYKLKKPVDLGFLDFSTRTARREVLHRELELNRRLAPDVYLGVSDVLDVDGGPGDHLLVMRRMPVLRRLAHLVRTGADVDGVVDDLAHTMAAFHGRCARGPHIDASGTRDALWARWQANTARARPFVGTRLDATLFEAVQRLVDRYLSGREALFDDRIRRGAVVDGHGDLLAEDIFCLDDGPRILDCIEFDDSLRHLDQLDDMACLAMDLERLGSPEAAARLIGAYASLSGDPAPATLVHHYVAYRAFMRAMVACLPHGPEHRTAAPTRLLGLAHRHLEASRVSLVLVGGPPGTGKSTVSAGLADELGWTVLSSDRIRKELAGIPAEEHVPAPMGQGIYTPEWTERTYAEMLHRAEALLALGECVVLDATWGEERRRTAAAAVASRTSSELAQVRCDLPPEVATARVAERQGGRDASDADAGIAHGLGQCFEPWPQAWRADTLPPAESVVARLRHRLQPWQTTPHLALPRLPAD
jgi:aminoglycoside phosphotransferase family enzyme/predicted kinase